MPETSKNIFGLVKMSGVASEIQHDYTVWNKFGLVNRKLVYDSTVSVLQVDQLADHLHVYVFSTQKPPAKTQKPPAKMSDWDANFNIILNKFYILFQGCG